MLQKERYDEIYAILSQRGSATVQYLQKHLYVSEATIRRDLEMMDKSGLIHRVWGGAMLSSGTDKDIPDFVREKTNGDKKAVIAAKAAQLLHDDISIFIDSSTTCHHLIPYFQRLKKLTVITNSLNMMRLLLQSTSASVHLTGGYVFENSILCGHAAVAAVAQYHADLHFFSCSGLSAEYGITSIESRVVEVNQAMMKHSDCQVLLCDSSKFDKAFLWHLAAPADVQYVVTDEAPSSPALSAALRGRLIP